MTYNSSFTGAQVDSVVDAGLPGGSTLYGVSNLLGTVSQSGGVPTGAVIQRSNGNANGDFVRFADGTLICTHVLTAGAATALRGSGVYRSSTLVTWNYPDLGFIAPPSVYGGLQGINGESFVGIDSTTNLSCRVKVMNIDVSDAVARDVRLTAIGRWF